MQSIKTKIKTVKIIKLDRFKDFRGKYIETFHKKKYQKKLGINFVQDDFSYSRKNILRGFHGDSGTWKLFTCVGGKIQFAVINFNKKDKNFLKNFSIVLNSKDNLQILVPPKHGVAHLVLSDNAILHYKQSTYYRTFKQFTINYQSKILNFKWLSKIIITSKRDSSGIFL